MQLIGYENEVSAAMQYVFGTTLICTGMINSIFNFIFLDGRTAKDVTFHPDIKMRSVTLEGDVYDPSGSLSGGSKPSTSGILAKLKKYTETKLEHQNIQKNLTTVNQKIKILMDLKEKIQDSKQQLELSQHELGLLEKQLSTNSSAQLIQQYDLLKSQLEECEKLINAAKVNLTNAVNEQKRIQSDMSEYSDHKESKLKTLQSETALLKKQIAKSAPIMREKQRGIDILNEELKEIVLEIENWKVECCGLKASIILLEEDVKESKQVLSIAKVIK